MIRFQKVLTTGFAMIAFNSHVLLHEILCLVMIYKNKTDT